MSREKEILTQEINFLLYRFSDKINLIFHSLKSESLFTSYGENYKEFIDEVYSLSVDTYQLVSSISCIGLYFSRPIGGKKQVKCNYELMMIEIRTDFNDALAGIMKPLQSPETFSRNVKEILEKHNKLIWLALIDDKENATNEMDLYTFLDNYSTYTEIPKDEELIEREKEKMRKRVANTYAYLDKSGQ